MKEKKKVLKASILLLLSFLMLLGTACGSVKDNGGETSNELQASDGTVTTDGEATTVGGTDGGDEENVWQGTPQNIKNYGLIDYRAGEGLSYNGIRLPSDWSAYAADASSDEVVTPPYLISEAEGGYRPEVIDITVGRQLFVDNFLIESTELDTAYHTATKYEGNPIVSPSTKYELKNCWGAGLSAGGVWYDMEDNKYKMWYDIAFNWGLGYAESDDGINWTRVVCNADGSNVVMDDTLKNGTCSVFIDYSADKSEKYKMWLHSFNNEFGTNGEVAGAKVEFSGGYTSADIPNGSSEDHYYASTLYVSSDGINWRQVGGLSESLSGDASSAFYNAFTHKWVNSIRTYTPTLYHGQTSNGRVRYYAEGTDFLDLLKWTAEDAVLWLKRDKMDKTDTSYSNGPAPQTYNFNAIAYESIMFGAYQIWYGPENNYVNTSGNPKITEIIASYSRDGFHFDRPDRTAFISAERKDGSWDKGYVFTSAGSMIVHDDEIWFYYSAMSGYMGNVKNGHANAQIGLAVLRRDGFASLEGKGETLTRALTCNEGKKYLFVNIDVPDDSFKAEIIDAAGNVVEGYSMEDCIAVGGDDTCKMITWKNGNDLSFLNGSQFRIRFSMEKDGAFYAFWLSDAETGESGGAVGSGYVCQAPILN